ncbi:CASP8-associated protein 2 [Arapaima gigas]
MELSFSKEMYRDLGGSRSDSPVVHDEDSVDIYSGLDCSPGKNEHADKLSTHISPGKLKDSMDLYEEIIKEEQQEREATYNEMKTKLDATENKVKELLCKLQQVQAKNTTLHTENVLLKKNICALIKTARMEILRKDEEISRLNQRQHNIQRHQTTRPDASGTCSAPAVVQTQDSRVNYPSKELYQHPLKDKNCFIKHPGNSCINSSPVTVTPLYNDRCISINPEKTGSRDTSALMKSSRDARTLLPVARAGMVQSVKVCIGDDTQQKTTVMQEEVSQNVKDGKQHNTEKRDAPNHDEFGGNKQKEKDREERNRDRKESNKDYTKHSRSTHQHHDSDLPRRPEWGNSPSYQKNSNATLDMLHRTGFGSHTKSDRQRDSREKRHKSSSQERQCSKHRNGSDKSAPEPSCKDGKQPNSSQGNSESRARHSSSYRGQRSPVRDLQRKERWRREEENNSRSERGRKAEKRDECQKRKSGKSEKDSHWKNDKSEKVRESESRGSLRDDKRNAPRNDYSTGIESLRNSRKDSAEGVTLLSQKDHGKRSVMSGMSSVECEAGKEKVPQANSQNKKLSFMETLNLTLSPVKKPRLCSDGGEAEDRGSVENLHNGQEESDRYDFGADYCVIDEVNNSHDFLHEEHKICKTPAVPDSVSYVSGDTLEPKQKCDNNRCGKESEQNRESPNQMCLTEKLISDSEVLTHSEDPGVQSGECKQSVFLENQESTCTVAQNDCGTTSEMSDGDSAVKTTSSVETLENRAKEYVLNSAIQIDTLRNGSVSVLEKDNGSSVSETLHTEPAVTVSQNDSACMKISVDHTRVNCAKSNSPLPVQPEEVCPPVAVEISHNHMVLRAEACDTSADDVSSTVNIEVLLESCGKPDITPEGSETVISTTELESNAEKADHCDSQLKENPVEDPESEKTLEERSVSEQEASNSVLLPKNCSEPDSTKDEEQNPIPSSSVPLYQDEDSMMLAFKNIHLIPNAISPLTSPVRPEKSQPLTSGKAPHVKSLNKDFSNVAIKVDLNKENEKPDCSSTRRPKKDQIAPASLSSSSSSEDENELEEGEIVSDSDNGSTPVLPSSTKNKSSLATARKNWSSPRSPARRRVQNMPVVSRGNSGAGSKTAGTPSKSLLSNKRHFKTIMPFLPKTSPSTVHEVMEMFKLIRSLMRKKYMKLHKTFPKKSFYNIIDMSLFSFMDFVSNANFSKLCGREINPKPKLSNIISVCMNKISNNGIVKRIFEQQSPSLKKKLWTFVEGQFDFLFKEIKVALTSLCKPVKTRNSFKNERKLQQSRDKEVTSARSLVTSVLEPNRKAEETAPKDQEKTVVPTLVSYRTGLGSRGKNLRITMEEDDKVPEGKKQDLPPVCSQSAVMTNKSDSITEKSSLRPFHNTSLSDKSDFDILTEQQASSLTFNLVADSQMGEIFKCLLQGSDLLENSVSTGDAGNWPVSTPRKDVPFGESFVSVTSPNKIVTPSKLVTAWSAISPCKFTSPNTKIRIPLSPAVFDESCMLEVPPSLSVNRSTSSSATISQRSYSILSEDLAVSLTIPSPLKSDSHLSFLNPVGVEQVSTPDCLISAHFSEDALLDGEDATEQDIHLALDSDNSSGGSTRGDSRDVIAVPQTFQFKPQVPMQAVVMEKSNDHFIVKIRHTSTSVASSPSGIDGAQGSSTFTAAPDEMFNDDSYRVSQSVAVCDSTDTQLMDKGNTHDTSGEPLSRESAQEPSGYTVVESTLSHIEPTPKTVQSTISKFKTEDDSVSKKRKKYHHEQKTKKARIEVSKEETKKKSKKMEPVTPPKKKSRTASFPLSPNSLSAENVVRRKGEVVVTWTREEDRDILVGLKTHGASAETFLNLSAKLKKSPSKIADRFSQLMKLFKKKEKMKC